MKQLTRRRAVADTVLVVVVGEPQFAVEGRSTRVHELQVKKSAKNK